MLCSLDARFDFAYESGAAASYLVIKAGMEEKVQHYQVEMVKNNKIDYILPFHIRQKDDKINFYYNITSRLALSHYLKRKKLKRDEFIKILEGISRALLDCRNYLLTDRCILLEGDYIFINPFTLGISFAYIPVTLDTDVNQKLKDFVINLILHSADIDESSSDNFLQRILGYAKADTFNVLHFNSLLKSLTNIGHVEVGQDSNKILYNPEPADCEIINTQAGENLEVQRIFSRMRTETVPPDGKSDAPPGSDSEVHECKFKPGPVVIAAVFQAVIVLTLIFSTGLIKSLNHDRTTTYVALVLIIAAIDTLLIKKLFTGKAITITKKETAPSKGYLINLPKRETWDSGEEQSTTNIEGGCKEEKTQVPALQHQAEANDFEDTSGTFPGHGTDTAVLEHSNANYPFLRGYKDGMVEDIPITTPDFVIGRLKDQVDYVSGNNAIGKVHARIILRDGSYYIIDLNSRNGTYINDARIASNKEYEIKNKDRISFANSDYTFIIP